jgi:hypothetical protein
MVPFLIIPLLILLALAFIPLLFVIRFRVGTARRRARPWVATINVAVLAFSVAMVLVTASILNVWVPGAVKAALAGLAAGSVLSVFGLGFTRWERTCEAMFYKPNRWFALVIPLALTLRIIYWMWRGWHVWAGSPDARSWFAASGTAGSLGVGAAVAGYYFGYAIGVWGRVRGLAREVRS